MLLSPEKLRLALQRPAVNVGHERKRLPAISFDVARRPRPADPDPMPYGHYLFDDGAGLARFEDEGVFDLRSQAPNFAALFQLADPPQVGAASKPLEAGRLLPPVAPGATIYAVGLNYRDHAAETGRQCPDPPPVFVKLPLSIAPPNGVTEHPGFSNTLDYEGELAVVIGRPTRNIDAAHAMDHVFGYTVLNDLTVRALAKPDTLLLGKNGPGLAPIGPWIAAVADVPDPHALAIRTWINGELRQDGSTADMHHRIADLIALISRSVPLMPGDIISTGSPRGSGIGFDPPRYLQPGDRVRVEIERVGAIETLIGPSLLDAVST
jgi:2-keto-4-pentenoate hydratase/2-oxohepta-3-ene-1,7-dioic acid hydratase in catechol pathway